MIDPDGHGVSPAPVRVVLRPLGSPLPLGFFAFRIGVLLTGLLDLRVLAPTDARQVAVLLLTFTAPLELLAAVLAFLARDSGAATALGVFGASWVSMLIVVVSAYGGLALLLEDGRGRLVLPTLRQGTARAALQGGLGDQRKSLESEAGVRKQL